MSKQNSKAPYKEKPFVLVLEDVKRRESELAQDICTHCIKTTAPGVCSRYRCVQKAQPHFLTTFVSRGEDPR